MDVSLYISELLEQNGDVSIPGLGYLVQGRISGYYNEAEQQFYPPRTEVQFEPSLIDDDKTLVQYIADKKNISLASSQYFTEKFVNNLKQEALDHEVAVATIGWFYSNFGTLTFRAAKRVNNDPAFYGLPPVRVNKLVETPAPEHVPVIEPVVEPTPIVEPEPIAEPTPIVESDAIVEPTIASEPIPEPVYAEPEVSKPESPADEIIDEEEEVYYEEPRNRTLRNVAIILATLLLIGLIVFGYMYKYNPALFEKITKWRPGTMQADTISKPILVKVDSLKVDTSVQIIDSSARVNAIKADSSSKKNKGTKTAKSEAIKTKDVTLTVTDPVEIPPPPPVKSTTAKPRRFEVIAIVVNNMADANKIVNQYKAAGMADAHIVPAGIRGPGIKISAGTYSSLDAAEVAMNQLMESGKINKDSYPIEIKR